MPRRKRPPADSTSRPIRTIPSFHYSQQPPHGLPSGRLIKTIPVFSQYPENGYGYSEETKGMLETTYGFIPWDDAHHPELSMTDGVPDGRWIFINGNNTPRVARIDLKEFKTTEILEIPNSAGNHASPFVTPNTDYIVASTRFSVPVPQEDMSIEEYKSNFKGTLSFIRANQPREMDVAFQILVPGFNYDLAHSGKGPSDGWMFFTSYNSEEAHTLLEVNASQKDKDFIAAVNYRRAEERSGVSVLLPTDCSDMIYYLPTPKSPHGVDVDPSGRYIVAGGKLSTVIPVHSFEKMQQALADEAFVDEVGGIQVLDYEAVVAGEVENPGLGPLHTEFDDRGYAYTTAFISSEIVKWELGTWEVVDRIDTYYSPGHLDRPGNPPG